MASGKVTAELKETIKDLVKSIPPNNSTIEEKMRTVKVNLNQEKLIVAIDEKKNTIQKKYTQYVDPISNLKSHTIANETIKIIDKRKKLNQTIKNNKNIYSLPKYKITKTQIYAISDEEIRSHSVANINSLVRDYGNTDGIFDERMGAIDSDKLCVTCNRDDRGCRGHIGHIELPIKFIKPTYQKKCIQTLQCLCSYCGEPFISEQFAQVLGVYNMPDEQRLAFCAEVSNKWLYKTHDHGYPHCVYNSEFTGYKLCFTVTTSDGIKKYERSVENMENIWSACSPEGLKRIGYTGKTTPFNFVMSCVAVLPPNLRPPSFIDGKSSDHMLTVCYYQILTRVIKLKKYDNKAFEREGELNNLYNDIKTIIYGPEKKSGTKIPLKDAGILNGYKTKKGMVRFYIMGKRVNYCGRSVAGPGHNLHPGESGVPKSFVKTMLVQDIVSKLNYSNVLTRFRNGDYHFMKMILVSEHGLFPIKQKHIIEYQPQIGDVLLRPIESGDMNITGRQPSLHIGSILSYTSVINETEQCTIQASDNPQKNADFDGDEFTQHFLQTIPAQAEAMTVHNFKNNIMSGESNRPMVALAFHGLIGWFLATANWGRGNITIPEKRFYEAISLVPDSYRKSSLFERLERVSLYTGKEIKKYSGNTLFSLCLPTNFTYSGNGLKIVDGILVEGVLKKSNIGIKVNSMIQILNKMYSTEEAVRFLNDAQFLADWFTMWHGLSIGYKDFNANRKEVLKMLNKEVTKMQFEFYNLGPRPKDPIDLHFWTLKVHKLLDKTREIGRKIGEKYIDKWNALNILSDDMGCGAKGGAINTSQITGSLGAQFVGATIVNYELKNGTRASPFFMPNDVAVESIGYIVRSYMDGISLSNAFFHNIAARLGLVDTAKSTGEVGYTHRRVVKSLEHIVISWLGMVMSTDDRLFSPLFNCGFDVSKMLSIKTKEQGETIFFADFKAEAKLLNRIYERKHLNGQKGIVKKDNPIETFITTNGRRPRMSEMAELGFDIE